MLVKISGWLHSPAFQIRPQFYLPYKYTNVHFIFQTETKTTKTYKGIHFGNLASKRLDLSKGKMGPGPGEYEPYRDASMKAENLNSIAEEQVRFEARIPRYHEAIQKDVEKKV